jgi:hypothetical protein
VSEITDRILPQDPVSDACTQILSLRAVLTGVQRHSDVRLSEEDFTLIGDLTDLILSETFPCLLQEHLGSRYDPTRRATSAISLPVR